MAVGLQEEEFTFLQNGKRAVSEVRRVDGHTREPPDARAPDRWSKGRALRSLLFRPRDRALDRHLPNRGIEGFPWALALPWDWFTSHV